ncbi:MAG: hypothetical protein PHO32_05690 [Candidatus Cloacimonetes bacterium]|nr:hypothetical protein [Candidatus Cloacimonadota bacterium]
MGTQQILLIVLSVIIVGVAIAVGISMFNSQAYNSNKTAIASDAQSFATQVVQYYKTPQSQGGFGGGTAKDASDVLIPLEDTIAALYAYLGWTDGETDNENGLYAVTDVTSTTVEITGYGLSKKGTTWPSVVTTVTFPNGTVTAVAGDDGAATGPSAVTP